MGTQQVLDILREGLKMAVLLSAPLLLFGLVAGVVINIFQAVTQISEHTLTIVPKILAIFLAILLFSPWMVDTMTTFTVNLIQSIPSVIR